MMTGIVFDGEQPRMTPFGPMVVTLVLHLPGSDSETWQSLGMRGTDSNDVAAVGVFVPKARSFVVAPVYEPGPQFTGPLYRLPALASTDVIGESPVPLRVPLADSETEGHEQRLADSRAKWLETIDQ